MRPDLTSVKIAHALQPLYELRVVDARGVDLFLYKIKKVRILQSQK